MCFQLHHSLHATCKHVVASKQILALCVLFDLLHSGLQLAYHGWKHSHHVRFITRTFPLCNSDHVEVPVFESIAWSCHTATKPEREITYKRSLCKLALGRSPFLVGLQHPYTGKTRMTNSYRHCLSSTSIKRSCFFSFVGSWNSSISTVMQSKCD